MLFALFTLTYAATSVEVPADAKVSVKMPATRKQEISPPSPIARHDDPTAVDLSFVVLKEALSDPLAMLWVLLLVAYFVHSHVLPSKDVDTSKPAVQEDAASVASSMSARSRKSRADRFALVVNQKLIKLETVDEVLNFAIQSSETGRTDIVNAVTAIHRCAKLMANAPPLQRVKVGQDPRLHALLDQLQSFLDHEHPPAILSRAVGNTSWALAKLQFRQDPNAKKMILETLQGVFVQHAQCFRPEEMMNAVWAFAELRRDKDHSKENERRVVAVAQAACKCIDKFPEFTLQQVVYFSWALARLSSIAAVKNEDVEVREGLYRFTQEILRRVKPAVHMLNTKNLAMLSWAAASLHCNLGLGADSGVAELLKQVCSIVEPQGISRFLPGEIASIVWALNKVHVLAPEFYNRFREHVLQRGLQGFSAQDISTILSAFVKSGTGNDALYEMLATKATQTAKDFNRSEKMLVQWAFTQLPHLAGPTL